MNIAIKKLEGRDHYVVPTVMITVGVHAGSQGPVYYPAAQLEASAPFWNSRPVVVYHPQMYGNGFVGDPEVFTRQRVGVLFNTNFDGHRLVAEAWIDVARVAEVDHRVERTIRNRNVMEVSTGLAADFAAGNGVWNGKHYHATVQRLTPDHLAILPDQRGACSVADGAGLCRNRDWAAAPASVALAVTGYSYAPGGLGATALAGANEEAPLVMPSMWE